MSDVQRAFAEATRKFRDLLELLRTCPVHGPMRYRPNTDEWVCPGWDGEGCPSRFHLDEG